MPFVPAPHWTDADLRAGRDVAEALFTEHRREEGPRTFERIYHELRPEVEKVFSATDDLTELTGQLFRDHPGAWQAGRYLTGPPISQEDLWTLVGGSKFRAVPAALADETAAALRVVLDPVRFVWLAEKRRPTPHEREVAVVATTALWAAQQIGTTRRGEASKRQEQLTGDLLAAAGMVFNPSRTPITFMDDMARGTYSRERRIAGAKCDVPIRLRDGRLFALECKVSNGPKNGWKRVNREVGGKATDWREAFGAHIITGVVLAGVFDTSSLVTARDRGVVIFWEHDLRPLREFVEASTS